jgi:hypothetical protein
MKPGNSGKKDFIKVPYSGSRWLTQLKSQLLKWLNTKLNIPIPIKTPKRWLPSQFQKSNIPIII